MKSSYSAAEVVAASVCYLARCWTEPGVLANTITAHHPAICRFCKTPLEELVAIATEGPDPHSRAAFVALPAKAQFARVREAAEPPWWEDVIDAEAATLTPGPGQS